ncbi:hypothetical protein SAMN02745751_02323 [Dethiosulfatibacter aminovorans DSM 17477]|uniref:DUF234 domain-containing protein n=1 Tax=Dethiosulfatibacter aminovorans DSM 17477 TaxID=1121476 RepID=A0A1M6IH48_9FIRM|nr:ATP-binding protein [Dethiosulfatibacter aminovorans]SHJ33752.1 hypothetical protein SAMN02745751_02323 [Dethiosulfatibacter aminovorans DSM 17477]
MNQRFIDRVDELDFLKSEYENDGSSFVVIYGRRRIGKTSLIREFLSNRKGLYFLATEEGERQNIDAFKSMVAEYTGNRFLMRGSDFSWEDVFLAFRDYKRDERKILVIDEFQYLGKSNKSFPSVFQKIWDIHLADENIMVILCGSLINMMESQVLSYSSPLYGRRTGQIKLKQISFKDYGGFFQKRSRKELIELYSVTGGVPKYIELLRNEETVEAAIENKILKKLSFLYEEPYFLLEKEVRDIGTYFSIIRTIASGNHKLGKIASAMGTNQTSITRYLKVLMDLDLIARIVPVTEVNPDKSKSGLYFLCDNFIEFWFKFIYPYRSQIEMGDFDYVTERIREGFVQNHVSYVYEDVCRQSLWELSRENRLPFKIIRNGKWWNRTEEIDIVALNDQTCDLMAGECKFTNNKVDVDVFYRLVDKTGMIDWKREGRKVWYVVFSISGFTDRLLELAEEREDLMLLN